MFVRNRWACGVQPKDSKEPALGLPVEKCQRQFGLYIRALRKDGGCSEIGSTNSFDSRGTDGKGLTRAAHGVADPGPQEILQLGHFLSQLGQEQDFQETVKSPVKHAVKAACQ